MRWTITLNYSKLSPPSASLYSSQASCSGVCCFNYSLPFHSHESAYFPSSTSIHGLDVDGPVLSLRMLSISSLQLHHFIFLLAARLRFLGAETLCTIPSSSGLNMKSDAHGLDVDGPVMSSKMLSISSTSSFWFLFLLHVYAFLVQKLCAQSRHHLVLIWKVTHMVWMLTDLLCHYRYISSSSTISY